MVNIQCTCGERVKIYFVLFYYFILYLYLLNLHLHICHIYKSATNVTHNNLDFCLRLRVLQVAHGMCHVTSEYLEKSKQLMLFLSPI